MLDIMNRRRHRQNGLRKALTVARIGSTVASAAFTGLRIAQGLAALINVERKVLQGNYLETVNLGTGTVNPISFIAQGDGSNTRDGISVLPKSLLIRMTASINTSATASLVRWIIVKDMQFDGVVPTVSDILDSLDPRAPLAIFSQPRFRVLKDFMFALNNDNKKEIYKKIFIQFNKPNRGTNSHKHWYHIRYQGTAADAASGDNGQLLIVALSDEVTNLPTINVFHRMRYIDN